jgi:hypothetical protein
MNKHYCHIDETGLDTEGDLFIVGVAVVDEERDACVSLLEQIEKQSGKGRIKWNKTAYASRLAYMDSVLRRHEFAGRLHFDVHRNHTQSYLNLTVLSIAKTLHDHLPAGDESIILIDGLPESKIHVVANMLRAEKLKVGKVRGVKREEHDALVRLADALCGFVRAATEEQPRMKVLLRQAIKSGHVIDLSEK